MPLARATGQLRIGNAEWVVTKDGDPDARAIMDRHYSRYRYADGRKPALFMGPGEKLALILSDLSALFLWRKFIDDSRDDFGRAQTGVNCAAFRNEGSRLSSELILEAEAFARRRWPEEVRFYTYVDACKTKPKRDPGYCFIVAGWKRVGTTRGGLVILAKVIR